MRRVVVIGGGYAGLAAALTLVRGGASVDLLESAPMLGGRARRIVTPVGELDNGQHLLLGAYRTLLGLVDDVHRGLPRPYRRFPLTLLHPGRLRLAAPPLPAPAHLLAAVLGATGLGWAERIQLLGFFARLWRSTVPREATVAQMLERQSPRTRALIWEPLCVAALNTRPEHASGAAFAEVLRVALGGSRTSSDLVLPTVDLSRLFPEPAAAAVVAGGGRIHAPARAVKLQPLTAGWRVATAAGAFDADAVVVAVGPHQVAPLLALADGLPPSAHELAATASALEHEPIVTAFVRHRAAPALPFPLLQLDGRPGEWLVDRGALGFAPGEWAIVRSAASSRGKVARSDTAAEVVAQLRRAYPGLAEPESVYVVEERRATYRCRPGERWDRGPALGRRLYVAGDYVHPRFPATLESAAATGVAAARAALEDR